MPYDSLVALGNPRPASVLGGIAPVPITRPLQCIRPAQPGDLPERVTDLCEYLGPMALPLEERARLQKVILSPAKLKVHPDWRSTAVGPAMNANDELELTIITPAMLRGLPEVTRKSLLDMLSEAIVRVSYSDCYGKVHKRRPVLGLPIGPHAKVNGATALAMCMATEADPTGLREIMLDGLVHVIDELQGSPGANIFVAEDVVFVLTEVMEQVLGDQCPLDVCPMPLKPRMGGPLMAPAQASALLNGAAGLVERYLQQVAFDSPQGIRAGMQRLLQGTYGRVPRDAAHLGLGLGIILAGAFRYVGDIGLTDFQRRRRVASIANMLWAMTSFAPLYLIAGPAAVGVVGAGIWWDYANPPRDYNDVVRRFESELMLLALRGELVLSPEQVSTMHLWIRQVLNANSVG